MCICNMHECIVRAVLCIYYVVLVSDGAGQEILHFEWTKTVSFTVKSRSADNIVHASAL